MRVFLIELEPVETRYTAQWQLHLPQQLTAAGFDVTVISGPEDTPKDTTPGAFLNFSGTNYWKSEQLKKISSMFALGQVKDGDYFLYTDAWNPTVIQLKYMASLLNIKIKIGGLWHAGSYDPQDFLGRIINNQPWVRHAEKSMFYVYDDNFFATNFHIELFVKTLFDDDNQWEEDVEDALSGENHYIKRVGWPMEYLTETLNSDHTTNKRDLIVFPHRIAPEKQVEIFKDLASQLPQYEFVICQEMNLTKAQYHQLLSEAKMVFSANLQETLGISWYEGVMMNCVPLVPDRLSYSEMGIHPFLYPSEWTINYQSYLQHRYQLMSKIVYMMTNYEWLGPAIKSQRERLSNKYFNGDALYQTIRNHHND
jgi:hypothetical protein